MFEQLVADDPRGAGRGGIMCKEELHERAAADFGYTVLDGKTTGNCGPKAFVSSAMAQGFRPSWKKTSEHKRWSDARRNACDWADKHREDKTWGGWSVQEICARVSHQPFDKWLSRMRLTDTWTNPAFLHALACSFRVDILLIESGNAPSKLVGQSLMVGDVEPDCCVPLVMHNYQHFWGVVPTSLCPRGDFSIEAVDGIYYTSDVEFDQEYDRLLESERSISGHEQEIQLCETLLSWNPFALPSPKLIDSLQMLASKE